VAKLKTTACDKLLEARVDSKLSAGKIKNDVMARITVALPKPRDGVVREASIPDSVLQRSREGAMDLTGSSGSLSNLPLKYVPVTLTYHC
jgi:hypothetical protein